MIAAGRNSDTPPHSRPDDDSISRAEPFDHRLADDTPDPSDHPPVGAALRAVRPWEMTGSSG